MPLMKRARRLAAPLFVAGLVTMAAAAAPAFASGGKVVPAAILGSGSDAAFQAETALDTLYNESPGCDTVEPSTQSASQQLNFSCLPDSDSPIPVVHTENYDHDIASEAYPLGGSVGVTQLCDQKQTVNGSKVAAINFALTTSAPSNPPTCHGLDYVAYALDGISWETFPGVAGADSAGVNTLTLAQLQGIFVNCTITQWGQINGHPSDTTPIDVYTEFSGFATRKAFEGFLGGSTQNCINNRGATYEASHVIEQGLNEAIASNGDAGQAIYFFSYGDYQTRVVPNPSVYDNGDSYLGEVSGVAPTATTIQSGAFPFTRNIYNVYCGTSGTGNCPVKVTKQTTNYIGPTGWICKVAANHSNDPITGVNYATEIRNTITNNGFVDLPVGPIGGGVSGNDYCRLSTT